MYIRCQTWGKPGLSWPIVMDELTHAAEQAGDDVYLTSTNGCSGMRYWSDEKSKRKREELAPVFETGFDLDITYTLPTNFSRRFLANSRVKAALYNYESSVMPVKWKKYYDLVDLICPSSSYVADIFRENGVPEEKIKVIPLGVDLDVFQPQGESYPIETEKTFKFLCVSEPHYRKQLPLLLDTYCQTFTNQDDVCLILKTKLFNKQNIKSKLSIEIDLRTTLQALQSRYGDKIPEIKLVDYYIEDIASLYRAADAFVLMTASEGWGMPYLEALATGTPVIAPNFGGQLEFLNSDNAILVKSDTRIALPQEQYWMKRPPKDAIVGMPDVQDYSNAMRSVFNNKEAIKTKYYDAGLETAEKFTWANALREIKNLL